MVEEAQSDQVELGSVDFALAEELVEELAAEDQADQVLPGSVQVEVEVAVAGVLVEDHSDHVDAELELELELVLVEAAGVLLAPSHSLQAVELAEVARTGVGYPGLVLALIFIAIYNIKLTDWCAVRNADLELARWVNSSCWCGDR